MKIAGIDASITGSGITVFELDENLDIVNKDYKGFTTKIKFSTDKITYYRSKATKKEPKTFDTYIDRNVWMLQEIIEFIHGCEYIALEDYAYKATGQAFHIGEFTGQIRKVIYAINGQKLRIYDIGTIKVFGCGKGNGDKDQMAEAFEKQEDKFDLSKFDSGKSPASDVVDSWFIAKLLRTELKLRSGIWNLKDLGIKTIETFNRVTKQNPVNILSTPFMHKENVDV